MPALPEFLRPIFWEVDFESLRVDGREACILERVLEHGDDQAIRRLRRTFPDEEIAEVLRRSRGIPPDTADLWSLVLRIPREEIRCFSTPSPLRPGRS